MDKLLPLLPTIGTLAVAVLAFLGGIFVALINRKPDITAQQSALMEAMQANREADSQENARLDGKIDKLYGTLHIEREYSMDWEAWHTAGMPDPPGRPRRVYPAGN